MDPDVPLLIPEVNAAHLDAIPVQQKKRGYDRGFIVTNPNCSTAGLVLVLKPLADAFGLEKVFVVTLQAVSGAGYPGVATMDIQGNVIPFISGEEEKMETEPQKLLGKWDGSRFVDAGIGLTAHCNRVPVLDGHLECVSIGLKKSRRCTKCRKRCAPLKWMPNSRRCLPRCVIPSSCSTKKTARNRAAMWMPEAAWPRSSGACANARCSM